MNRSTLLKICALLRVESDFLKCFDVRQIWMQLVCFLVAENVSVRKSDSSRIHGFVSIWSYVNIHNLVDL